MTTREQDAVIEALANEHGGAKVLPGLDGQWESVLACGWMETGRQGPWRRVFPNGAWLPAFEGEILAAYEALDVRHEDAETRTPAYPFEPNTDYRAGYRSLRASVIDVIHEDDSNRTLRERLNGAINEAGQVVVLDETWELS